MHTHRVPIRLGSLRTAVRDAPATPDLAVRSTTTESTGAALFAASAARVCRVCAQNTARYTCPRCNAPYCSAACYKRHGDACTEQFFEEHVRSAVALESADARQGDSAAQRKVNDMLARVKQFQDESASTLLDSSAVSDDEDEALARLADLVLADDSNTQLTLDALTPQQRKRFLAEVADGRLSQFVALWQPWWLLDVRTYECETNARRRALVIQELSAIDHVDEDAPAPLGPVMIEAAAFPAAIFTHAIERAMPASLDALLHGRAPSPLLRIHVIEVLFSYALVLRTFNGDWEQDPVDAATALLHLAPVLTHTDVTYDAVDLVLHACLAKDLDGSDARALNRRAVHDVTRVLAHKIFVLDALTDARALVTSYASHVVTAPRATSKAARAAHRSAQSQLVRVEKKLAFFQTWAFHTSESRLSATARELDAAAALLATESASS